MKRFLTTCIMIAFVFGMFSVSAFAEEQVEQEKYSYTSDGYGDAKKLVELPYGDSEETLGHWGGYGEKISPQSFFIEENGNIYVLDTLNDAVKKYFPDGTYDKMIPLPEDIYGLDLEKAGDFLFVYADNHKLYMINESTPDVYWVVATISAWDMEGLYAADGELYIRSCNGTDKKLQLVTENNRNERMTANDSAPVCISNENTTVSWQREENTAKSLSYEKNTATLSLTCRLDPLGAFYAGKIGNMEYAVTNETDWSYAETRVTKFVNGKNTASALAISGKEYAFGSPFKKIYIQNDIVYQMMPEENGIAIYQIPWSSSVQTRFSEEMVEQFEAETISDKNGEEEQNTTDTKVVDITESEENIEESMDLPQVPNPPILVDYNNLTEEQEALIQQNEENAFTDEEIARMSPEELEKYQLLPLDGEIADPISTNGSAFYGAVRTSGIAYYGGTDCNHYITGISIHTGDGTYKGYVDMVIIAADQNSDGRYYGNHGIPFEVLTAAMQVYSETIR